MGPPVFSSIHHQITACYHGEKFMDMFSNMCYDLEVVFSDKIIYVYLDDVNPKNAEDKLKTALKDKLIYPGDMAGYAGVMSEAACMRIHSGETHIKCRVFVFLDKLVRYIE